MTSIEPDLPGAFLFLDESGDVGVSERASTAFVISVLHLRSEFALARVIKRARRRVFGRHAPMNEAKWSASGDPFRFAVLNQIRSQANNINGISGAVLLKKWVNETHAKRRGDTRYNYIARMALEQGGLLNEGATGRRVKLIVDARSRQATETLTEYVNLLRADGAICCDVTVEAGDSQKVPELQAADFVSGSIFAAYAFGDWKYLNLLSSAGLRPRLRVLGK